MDQRKQHEADPPPSLAGAQGRATTRDQRLRSLGQGGVAEAFGFHRAVELKGVFYPILEEYGACRASFENCWIGHFYSKIKIISDKIALCFNDQMNVFIKKLLRVKLEALN